MRLRDWLKKERRPGIRSYSDAVAFLSREIEVTKATVYGWANGDFLPTLDKAIKIQKLTGNEVLPEDLAREKRSNDHDLA